LTGVRAVSHRETTGIGDAIDTARSSWILRFNGLSADDVALTADGGRIDAISGASVTSRAVVESVRGRTGRRIVRRRRRTRTELFGCHR
jgi:electron transport complex protein RnfG